MINTIGTLATAAAIFLFVSGMNGDSKGGLGTVAEVAIAGGLGVFALVAFIVAHLVGEQDD